MTTVKILLAAALAVVLPAALAAQTGRTEAPRVPIAFNRYYDHAQMTEVLQKLRDAWPDLVTLESIGKSVGGLDLWVATINNPKTGPADEKAAIYIDANVHGNEVQGAEVCLYTIWYLMENYGRVERITALVDERVFYILPSVNPDGRDHWFKAANSSSSSRSGIAPVDSDRDGLLDEDPTNDLDGDGSITQMRKKVGKGGTHELDPEDPRFLVRVKPDEDGEYLLLGSEGIDDDRDGRLNEDGVGGYDMNRNNPADWQPGYVQSGAGDYPLSWPETRAVADFLIGHPNVAAVQSYHNAGGMLLRGPGSADVAEYPRADLSVYDELGKMGERVLPFYRYMVIHKDLYTVHGGFVNLAAEGLGIISFTNELWASAQSFNTTNRGQDDRRDFDDLLMMGGFYRDWRPFEHPQYGSIEIGGYTKWSSRVAPPFMLEELCHRNTAFTLNQAEQMPRLELGEATVEALAGGLRRVRVTVRNTRLIPTRSTTAAQKKIGRPDLWSIDAEGVLAAGIVSGRWPDETVVPVERDLARLRLEEGVGSHGRITAEWIISGPPPYRVTYRAEKGGVKQLTIEP